MREVIPTLKICPTYITKYYEVIGKRKADPSLFSHDYNHELHHSATLSKHSIKKIKKAIDWIVYLSKKKTFKDSQGRTIQFKLNFITLTLPSIQKHDDKVIVRTCLNNFLNILRNKYQVENYIWRAERQKNGNLHFHLITDKFVYYNDVRKYWNQSLEQLYYVSDYEQKMKDFHRKGFRFRNDLKVMGWDYQKQYNAWIKGRDTNWREPNTTDVHSVRYVGNLKVYLLKYFTKQYQNENIECMLWHCSRSLSKLDGYKIEMDSGLVNFWYSALDKLRPKFVTLEFATIACVKVTDLIKLKYFDLYKQFQQYINETLLSVLELSPG